jgi:phosphate transport system substrate-binding protein
MKRKIAIFLLLGLVSWRLSFGIEQKPLSGNISISGAWALYPMVLKWAEEFQKIHPQVKIDVQAGGAGKGIADVLANLVDIGMVSRDVHPAEIEKGAFPIAVTKDAVVPTISADNPFLKEIQRTGLKKETLQKIWLVDKPLSWGEALGAKMKEEIHVYTRSDACGAAETWAAYLGGRQEDLLGVGVYGDPGLADAVKRDHFGIGYNNINFAYDAKTLKPIAGLAIAPIDLNGDSRIDKEEMVYGTRDDITRAIGAGIYPSPPARDLYLVLKGKPSRPLLAEFLRWVLTDGQKYVPETGYIPLRPEKLSEALGKLK